MEACRKKTLNLYKDEVKKAIEVLKEIQSKQNEKEKSDLFSDGSHHVRLQFAVRKATPDQKIIKLKLPHSIYKEEQDVCLFVKDLDKTKRDYDDTVEHFEHLLSANGITCVSKVIPLKSLKLEYKPFEAKKNLSNMFDIYLSDERILRLLSPLLGKNFYARKKFPVGVNLKAVNLKKEIDTAIGDSQCILTGRGSCFSAVIGHTAMTDNQLTENTLTALANICKGVPGGSENIKNVFIKSDVTMALPLYASYEQGNVKIPQKKTKQLHIIEEIDTVMNGKVKITAEGKIKVLTEKTEDCNEQPILTTKGKKRAKKLSIGKPVKRLIPKNRKDAKARPKRIKMGKGPKSKRDT